MNTANNKRKKKPDVPGEDAVLTLDVILDLYENGDLDMSVKARECYLTEQHKAADRRSWLHNDDLANQIRLRRIGKQNARDLLR